MKTKQKEITAGTRRHEPVFLDEVDRLFDHFLSRGWLHPFRDLWPEWTHTEAGVELRTPRVDIINRDDELVVRAEMPGITRDELTLELDGDLLTIRGEQHREHKTEEGDVMRAEIARGAFSRTTRLPAGVDAEHARAELADGVLVVHLPKTRKSDRKRIEIG